MKDLEKILGMYLGCKLRFSDTTDQILTEVGRGHFHIAGFGDCRFEIKDVKLLLKPLSSITQQEIKEFEKVFRVKNNQRVLTVRKNGVYVIVDVESQGFVGNDHYEAYAIPDEIDFLRSLGYDINVPDEYKVIEG